MEWKPIETAPRDGTHVLLFAPEDHPKIVVGFYEVFDTADGATEEWWAYADMTLRDISGEIGGGAGGPTHWMPLPDEPA